MSMEKKKYKDTSTNYFYGVNVNDKEFMQEEYDKLKRKHKLVTIVVIIVLVALGAIVFDFYRVSFREGKPIFALQSSVKHGTLFKGLGYKVLYCDNGERYLGSVLYKTCEEIEERTFVNVIYEKLIDYATNNKLLDFNNLDTLVVNSILYDENNNRGGSDYLVNVSFTCKDNSDKCFKVSKEYYEPFNINFYIQINKYNELYNILTFKSSGEYYNKLKELYTEKVKEYLLKNNLMEDDNVRLFSLELVANYGMYKFRGVTYADSYLVEINYMCLDGSNTCVEAIGHESLTGDYANQTFNMAMFLNYEDTILLMGPKEYFDL